METHESDQQKSAKIDRMGPDAADPVARPGRPKVLDEVKQRELCALLSAGASMNQAAAYVGCTPVTIRRLKARDPDFAKRLGDARLAVRLQPLNSLHKAAKHHWRAAAWLQERQDRADAARRAPSMVPQQQVQQLLVGIHQAIDVAVFDQISKELVLGELKMLTRRLKLNAPVFPPSIDEFWSPPSPR